MAETTTVLGGLAAAPAGGLLSGSTWRAALGAGVVAGTLDLVFAVTAWTLQGVPAKTIPMSIASGVLGKDAFSGGAGTIALGLTLHYAIVFLMAFALLVAAAWAPTILAKPLRWGGAYGAFLYLIMNFVVVPLSRAPIGRPPLTMAMADFGAHVLLVGIPMALVASRLRA